MAPMAKLEILVVDDDPLARKIMAARFPSTRSSSPPTFRGAPKAREGPLSGLLHRLKPGDDCSGLKLILGG